MDVALLYFEDCPNWKVTEERLTALVAERPDVLVSRYLVDTPEEAERTRSHGSPSIQVDGVDLFATPDAKVGLSCRRYASPDGYQGTPTLDQLHAVFADA
ncbi:thioredoxin family protein [Pseudokineococcus basanitobsidens]|uniref:Thioredoxin family protein n=1 Tax=Pseudokineococcus basanitobsidens TaxID=1926649 RepID=A0ABU8RP76_9ACTN